MLPVFLVFPLPWIVLPPDQQPLEVSCGSICFDISSNSRGSIELHPGAEFETFVGGTRDSSPDSLKI